MAISVETEQAQHGVDLFGGRFCGEVAELGDHGEVLVASEVGVEEGLFGDVAHAPLVGREVFADGPAFKADLAEGRLDEAGDHFDGGGFAGAVGAEIAGDLAGEGGEADVLNDGNAGVAFEKSIHLEHLDPPDVNHYVEFFIGCQVQ